MGSQLTGRDFWDLVQHILPFYIILFIAYGFAKKQILTKAHGIGLARWTSLVGIPIYVGNMLAFNDPYKINLRLVGADALQKVLVLIIATIWWRFSKNGSKSGNIDGIITFFMLATLSNLVLVGPALFESLHGDESKVSIATLIILQCALWYNLCIVLFETRVVLKELALEKKVLAKSFGELEKQAQHFPVEKILALQSPIEGSDPEATYHREGNSQSVSPVRLQRTTSAPARVSFSTARVSPFPAMFLRAAQEDAREGNDAEFISEPNKLTNNINGGVGHEVRSNEPTKAPPNPDNHDIEGQSVTIEVLTIETFEVPGIHRAEYAKIIAIKVLGRVRYAPLTYTSIVGFVYSLMAFKWGWDMPYPIKTSIELVANGAIAISVVVMALTWFDSGRLISCGVKKMTYGFIIRFFIGPVIMVGCSLAFGLTGIAFEFAVLQSALPLGLVSFVLAKEYNLDIEVFSTAVITQLVVFLPIVVVYYFILQPIGI